MTSEDTGYYRARAVEERARAAAAAEPYIANIHRDLAGKYEALARETDVQITSRPLWDWSDVQVA